ncbi:glycosyltransferase [Micromonospora sp. NBS 11-29]|uniref:glycosyltransferase n=1 Tax=Micromonospora sp. NBS 11-29 TaxID=1960879 RepID=UPI000B78DC95|nr:glycosyltransferase [Micromonospora sp. NBS 11-29]
MRVVVTSETRFVRSPDGAVWTKDGPAARFFARYLAVFDQVRVVARVAEVASRPPHAGRVDGDGIEVWPVPHYQGPGQYLLRRQAVKRSVEAAADDRDSVILRVPSIIGAPLASLRGRRGRPYALEVVGDPHDVFAPGVVRHPLRPLLRARETERLRRLCRQATAVAYVTESHLQRRYPVGPDGYSTSYSSIDLPTSAFTDGPRRTWTANGPFTLVSLGSLEQLYKGVDTLLHAVARLRGTLPVRLVHVGDGRFRPYLVELAGRLGVTDLVTFAGSVPPGDAVRRQLDRADLFVMPSRTEGLPKALIEAMARGLPAIGTTVGGIPELLSAEDLIPADDPAVLARAIHAMLTDPDRMARAAARNHARASAYAEDVLRERRTGFYRSVRDSSRTRHAR